MGGIRSLGSAALAAPTGRKRQSEQAYASNWEHIEDELARLDLRLRLCTLRRQLQSDSEMSQTLLAAIASRTAEIGFKRSVSLAAGVPLALDRLSTLFRLSGFEEACLLICLAADLDTKYEQQYSALQFGARPMAPSVSLVLDLLCDTAEDRLAGRRALSPSSPLKTYRLLQSGAGGADAPRTLRIDARIADFLLGANALDSRILPAARLSAADAVPAPLLSATDISGRMKSFIRHHLACSAQPRGLVFQLHGPDLAAQRAVVEMICSELALALVSVDLAKLESSPPDGDWSWLVGREAVLLPAALCLEPTDIWLNGDKHAASPDSWFSALRHFSQLSFLLGRTAAWPGRSRDGLVCIDVEIPAPGVQVRRALWEACLAAHGVQANVDPGALASRFRFDARQIRDAVESAESNAYWRNPMHPGVTADDVAQACRAQVSVQASGLAQKLKPVNRWSQLVLPPDHHRQLRELCNQARLRHIVYGDWGFERRLSTGNGLNALFTGPPGTGKTMAAEVVAAELQADLLKIDLSQTVSKYIGETEKNLDQLFREAEAGHAILFFDEADALFGKRSEVKDAHDRYANIETGYLLQRMEQHEGIVILATNLRNNLDEAFCRRMHFVIEFPFPDEAHRRALWEGLFPPEVPRAEPVDFAFMARQFKVPGGNIRNIGVCAAFLAAAEGQGLAMHHLIQATRREYRKLGWPCNVNDFGPYHAMLQALDG